MMKVKEGNIVVSGVYIYILGIFGFLEFDRTKNK